MKNSALKPPFGTFFLLGFALFVSMQLLVAPWLVNRLSVHPFLMPLFFLYLSGGAVLVLSWLFPASLKSAVWGVPENFWKNIGIGVVSGIFITVLLLLIQAALSLVLGSQFWEDQEQELIVVLRVVKLLPGLFGLFGIALCGVIPYAEEILFRGLLQNFLFAQWGSERWSIGVTSLLFAFLHGGIPPTLDTLPLVMLVFCGSCVLGLVYCRTEDLRAPIAAHMTLNAITWMGVAFE